MSTDEPNVPVASPIELDRLVFDDRGLLPVVAQDLASGAVLMVAWADREAIETTLATGFAHFWSRSRKCLWKKGETSGNVLEVVEAVPDCDRDTVLYRVRARGPACHHLTRTCFEPNPSTLELGWLAKVLAERSGEDPEKSYTARLLARGLPRIAQKVGEEAVETVIAGLDTDGESTALVEEASDLLYHLLVLLQARGVGLEALAAELTARHRKGAGQ